MKKFQEYMDNRGKTKGTAATLVVADKLEDIPDGRKRMPPKEKYRERGQPYWSDGEEIHSTKMGLGDQGSEKPYDITKKREKEAKIPTAEFAHHELLPKIRDAIKSYPAITENLVRELQRNNLLGILIGEMLSHNETYQHIAEVMASKNHGLVVCRKLAKAMREGVAAPFHHAMDQEDEMDPNSGGVDPNLGIGTGDETGGEEMGRPSMNFSGGDDEFGDDEFGNDGEDFDDDEFGDANDEMGAEDPMAKIAELEARIKELEAGAGGGTGDLGTEDEGDPYAPGGMQDPNAVGPDGQPMPPNPNQPSIPPRPTGPPAMENMRRAMNKVFENYKPLVRSKK